MGRARVIGRVLEPTLSRSLGTLLAGRIFAGSILAGTGVLAAGRIAASLCTGNGAIQVARLSVVQTASLVALHAGHVVMMMVPVVHSHAAHAAAQTAHATAEAAHATAGSESVAGQALPAIHLAGRCTASVRALAEVPLAAMIETTAAVVAAHALAAEVATAVAHSPAGMHSAVHPMHAVHPAAVAGIVMRGVVVAARVVTATVITAAMMATNVMTTAAMTTMTAGGGCLWQARGCQNCQQTASHKCPRARHNDRLPGK